MPRGDRFTAEAGADAVAEASAAGETPDAAPDAAADTPAGRKLGRDGVVVFVSLLTALFCLEVHQNKNHRNQYNSVDNLIL